MVYGEEKQGACVSRHALIIVDMAKDNVNTSSHGMIDIEAKKIIPIIVDLAQQFRKYGSHVVFACDSFMEGDFIFRGRMPQHAIRGTGGDQPISELEMQPSDLYLPKRRMSAFYKTDLDQTLRTWGVDTVAVCGIVTNVCVLMTAMDAIQNDFRAVIISDACACYKPEIHEMTLRNYENFLLEPIFRIMTSAKMAEELEVTA
jgi:nicotinamidase/pyrazinamidase